MSDSPQQRVWGASWGVLPVCVVASAAIGLICGCEQRVVGTSNQWSSTPRPVVIQEQRVTSNGPRSRKGFLDQVGDVLFGWTRHLGGDESDNEPRQMTRPPSAAQPITRSSQSPQ